MYFYHLLDIRQSNVPMFFFFFLSTDGQKLYWAYVICCTYADIIVAQFIN